MGNQLVSIAPSQILPVERYLNDYSTPELKFVYDKSLGSTRFLKVARANLEDQEGSIVVKVFAIHDPSLPLSSHKERIEVIRKKLSSAVNCIPFQKILINDKAAFIIREYVKYSLYDRISTRPFLSNIEKRWITFQILYALHQCHKNGVCHGDIKLENIAVTSWNWVLLVDFASFKPTVLPEDNPADYSYFFDTSRRRICYIAPERFAKNVVDENSILMNEASGHSKDLTPAMDIFSAGCALLELWNELDVPFEYSELLAYSAGKYFPDKALEKLEDENLRSLISSMIEIDPSKRLSAENYLAAERGKLFPEYFFTFLQSYMLIFSSTPTLTPDEKIMRLKNDIGNILSFMGPSKIREEQMSDDEELWYNDHKEYEGMVLITSLVTSCIRGLYECSSKLYTLDILLELALHANNETILDRILPYIVILANDPTPRVKISAMNTITKCLGFVKRIKQVEANIFTEFILPGLSHLVTDPNTNVRAAFGKNLPKLAEIAFTFLEEIRDDIFYKTNTNEEDDKRDNSFNYELELQALHENLQHIVTTLLTDSQSLVKQTLLQSEVSKLCVVFGKSKANDIILSHMITFLNDKEDVELRALFYDCIVEVAAYIGCYCSVILTPLLLQGLKDSSELVTYKALIAMTNLTEIGVMNKFSICELISGTVCFLVHPSLKIRQAVAGFVSISGAVMHVLDVQSKIIPKVEVYLRYPLLRLDRSELIEEALVNPISREIYDSIIAYSDIELLLDVLKRRMELRKGLITVSTNDLQIPSLKNFVRRLESIGMNEDVEVYIVKMGPHLQKIHKHKRNVDARLNKRNEVKMEFNSSESSVKGHIHNLAENHHNLNVRKLQRANTSGSIDTNVNSDWNYSSEILNKQSESTNSGGPPSRATNSRPSSPHLDSHGQFGNTEASSNISLHEKSYIQCGRSKARCYLNLLNVIAKQQEDYTKAVRSFEWAEQNAWQPQIPPPDWRLKSSLVAHMHEHKGAITKLATLSDTSLFASSSMDGYVRLWDCAKVEKKSIANRSVQQYKMQNSVGVIGITTCDGGQSIASANQDGVINILRIDPASSRMNLLQSKRLILDEEGPPMDINCIDYGSQSTVIYATLHGSIVGWDLRCPGISWRLENNYKYGFITTFCLDKHHNWLTVGTRTGYHVVWDLRFQIPVTTIEHPIQNIKVKKVISHPTKSSWIISSVQGNNEMDMWNLETAEREKVLWGSSSPPLTYSPKSEEHVNAVCAMYAGCIDGSPFLLTGGIDKRIRYWDLANTESSYLAVPSANDQTISRLEYSSRLVEGSEVTLESIETRPIKLNEESPPEPPAIGHKDTVSDIILCKATNVFVASGSRDGVIKVWK